MSPRSRSVGRTVPDPLPERYARWREDFDDRVTASLAPGMVVLDVGAGRDPTVAPGLRPPQCRYVGLDASASELDAAPPGSYDEVWCADIANHLPELDGKVDLVVSWQVLEHVHDLPAALGNIQRYLRPGGRLIAQLSGRFSVFGLVNLAVPTRLGPWLMEALLQRPKGLVFPAYYHRCWYSALAELGAGWARFEILPRYAAGVYFGFSRSLQKLYLRYEDWAVASERRNLATHYLIVATR